MEFDKKYLDIRKIQKKTSKRIYDKTISCLKLFYMNPSRYLSDDAIKKEQKRDGAFGCDTMFCTEFYEWVQMIKHMTEESEEGNVPYPMFLMGYSIIEAIERFYLTNEKELKDKLDKRKAILLNEPTNKTMGYKLKLFEAKWNGESSTSPIYPKSYLEEFLKSNPCVEVISFTVWHDPNCTDVLSPKALLIYKEKTLPNVE